MPPGPLLGSDHALLAAIIDATEQAVISLDLDGRVTSWNRGAEDLYGWTADEVLGQHYELVLGSGSLTGESIAEIVSGGSVGGVEAMRSRRDGTAVMVGETTAPVRDPDGSVAGVAMIARDITERLETEALLEGYRQELDLRNEHLERSNRDLEQFAYVASHDLSEPLRAVAGMVGLLSRRYSGQLGDDADEFIDFAVDGCERMRRMISDLLTYSRAGRSELAVTDVDLGSVVDDAAESLGVQREEPITEIVHAGLPTVRGDRTQLTRVVQNLVSNAVKFRRPGCPVRIEVSARRLDGDDGWRIEVADDGIGVEEQYRERIFRMFQRLHTADQHPGTGIGLSISERIVDQHGGRMGTEGNERGGSTFWFSLPDHPDEVSR